MRSSLPWYFGLPVVWFCLAAVPFAQQTASPGQSSSKTHRPASARSKSLAPGGIENGVYRNGSLGLTYKLPFGWVDRTADLREGANDPSNAQVLLAVFERPPEATGETVNSAVVILAEDADSYPGLKSAAQYFGPLTELSKAKGFTVVHEPYEFALGAKTLVRGDFQRELGPAGTKTGAAPVSMHQSILAMLARGYVISFTFLGADEDEVEELVGNLSFAGAKGIPPKPVK